MGKSEGARARQRLLADYETRVQHGAERIYGVVSAGAAAWLHQSHRARVAGIPGGARARVVIDHHSDVSDSQAGRRSCGQRLARAGFSGRNPPGEEREIGRDPRWELAITAP